VCEGAAVRGKVGREREREGVVCEAAISDSQGFAPHLGECVYVCAVHFGAAVQKRYDARE
jgi:hypothetical protein